jgi:hypothetical protein
MREAEKKEQFGQKRGWSPGGVTRKGGEVRVGTDEGVMEVGVGIFGDLQMDALWCLNWSSLLLKLTQVLPYQHLQF